jgi:hypothetical protein
VFSWVEGHDLLEDGPPAGHAWNCLCIEYATGSQALHLEVDALPDVLSGAASGSTNQ